MLESYRIGVTLQMSGNVSTSVDRLIRDMDKLEKRIGSAGNALTRLSNKLMEFGSAGRGVERLSRAMDRLGSSGSNRAASDLTKMVQSTDALIRSSERLTRVLQQNARLASDMASSTAGSARSGARTRGTSGPGAASGHYGNTHDGVMGGVGLTMAGAPLVRGAQSAFERAVEIGHLRTQLLTDTRVSPVMADQAVAAAYKATTTAPGTTVAQNMKAIIDLKNQNGMPGDGTFGDTMTMLPQFAQMTALLQTYDRKQGIKGDLASYSMRAMDILGGMSEDVTGPDGTVTQRMNPELLQQRLDAMMKVAVVTNMRVSPQQYLGFAKQARAAGMVLSDKFIYEQLPAIMDSTGGPRAGTAFMSALQVFSKGGTLTDKNYDRLAAAGLATPATYERREDPKTGKMKRLRVPSAIYDADLMFTDPVEFSKRARERMAANGITDTTEQVKIIGVAMQRATVGGMFADLFKDSVSIGRFQKNYQNTRPDLAQFVATNDPAAKMQQFQASFDKMMASFGSASMPDAIFLMDKVTAGLNALAEWAAKNPGQARVLTDTAAGLGALAVALGTVSTAIFLLLPALRMFGLVSGGAAAAGAASGAGGALGAASRLALGGPIGLGLGVGAGVLALGSSYETAEARAALESEARLRRGNPMASPQDGFGIDGRPLTASPTGASSGGVTLYGDMNMDGAKVGNIVARGIADQARRSSSGLTGPDLRIDPFGAGNPIP